MYYDIVEERNIHSFKATMNFKLSMGWKPLGSLTILVKDGTIFYL